MAKHKSKKNASRSMREPARNFASEEIEMDQDTGTDIDMSGNEDDSAIGAEARMSGSSRVQSNEQRNIERTHEGVTY